MMAGYCRNMQEPVPTIKQWHKSVHIIDYFYNKDKHNSCSCHILINNDSTSTAPGKENMHRPAFFVATDTDWGVCN
jgi:hypothetical protein